MSVRAVRWCAFISGRGSNLAALLEARREADGLFDLALVVSSSRQAPGLARARRDGVPTLTLDKKIDWSALNSELTGRHISHLFLCGFLRIVPAEFCRSWSGRLFNLHPSLLPNYPGLDSIARAHGDGAEIGVSVHEAAAEVDAGRLVAQRLTQRNARAGDAPMPLDLVEARVHVAEQRLSARAVRALTVRHRLRARP